MSYHLEESKLTRNGGLGTFHGSGEVNAGSTMPFFNLFDRVHNTMYGFTYKYILSVLMQETGSPSMKFSTSFDYHQLSDVCLEVSQEDEILAVGVSTKRRPTFDTVGGRSVGGG